MAKDFNAEDQFCPHTGRRLDNHCGRDNKMGYERRPSELAWTPVKHWKPVKRTSAETRNALAASDRIAAISAEIRKRNGLAPLTDSGVVEEWRAEVGEIDSKPLQSVNPRWLTDVAKRRRRLEDERAALDREIAAMVQRKAFPASKIAKALGLSRQRVYQLAG